MNHETILSLRQHITVLQGLQRTYGVYASLSHLHPDARHPDQAHICQVIAAARLTFGATTLEDAIQSYVALDLERQLATRREVAA